ncbi:MAG: tetratricopeptide repeat protein [Actinomycetota bacterium]|nr:tetratricopeptide repeat protein [Actinomycetota bacterium]
MMMNRERLGFWVKLLAIVLAVFFIGSSVFLGLGTNVSYNLFELFGNSDQQQQENQAPDPQDQIDRAEKDLKQNPKDPEAIKDLASLYYNAGRYDDAVRVLQEGREAAPKDEEIPLLMGQVYSQEAQGTPGKEQKEVQKKAGDAFAAAAEVEPDNEEAYLLAGDAYEKAGQPAEAIKYYNGYLDREPKGENSEEVKARISALLEGGDSTGGG